MTHQAAGAAPRVTVIGLDGRSLDDDARAALADAHLVVGGRRHLTQVALPTGVRQLVMGEVATAVAEVATAQAAGQRVVVLASGDPGFFGVVRALGDLPLTVLPGVSSVALALSRLGRSWDDAVVVSAHGRPLRPAVEVLRRYAGSGRPVVVLTDASSSPGEIVRSLGPDAGVLHVFEHLGLPGETHTRIVPDGQDATGALTASEAVSYPWQSPNVVVSASGPVTGRPWHQGLPTSAGWALPDDAFSHRDGMLTKREVRAVVLSRLEPRLGTLVWDVGSGSGAVAVECSRLGSSVIAVEQDAEGVRHLEDNACRHGAVVRTVHGRAPAALADLPDPSSAFVGGGGPDVVAAVAARRPDRLVVALATVERVATTVAALGAYDVDTVLLQASRLAPLGSGSRLVPTNPVFVVAGVLS